jgi:hypothetical protein
MTAIALSAFACATQDPQQPSRAAASVSPWQIDCYATDCSWLDAPDACQQVVSYLQQVAPGLGLSGTFTGVTIAAPPAGVTSATAGADSFTVNLAFDRSAFDWQATRTVDVVFSRNARGAMIYPYVPAAAGDTAVENFRALPPSHVDLCFKQAAPPQYALEVSKTAEARFKRTWGWSIAKSASVTDVTAAVGAAVNVSYDVTASAHPLDSEWTVVGTIVIYNPAPVDATGVALEDSFAGTPVTPDCGSFNGTIPAGGTLSCTYAQPVSGAFDGVNVVTVTATGVAGGSAYAAVTFGTPTSVVDECVSVVDDRLGALGTACAAPTPVKWTYTLAIGPYPTCDASGQGYPFVNTASFAAPSGATGSASWTVTAHVACAPPPPPAAADDGCTLSQGYWKTHSRKGPAPYDARWGNLGPLEEDTPFFLSGRTWYQAFRTPVWGLGYYALAHQYMAAKLNVLAGANPDAVAPALAAAEAFFATSTPATPLSWARRVQVSWLAVRLDAFNSGRIGPGHCDGG